MTRRISYAVVAFLPLFGAGVAVEAAAIAILVRYVNSDWIRLFTIPVVLIGLGLWSVLGMMRGAPDEYPGAVVSPDQQPQLWGEVRDLALQLGVPVPDRVVIQLGAHVTVRDGKRSVDLLVGVPHLAGADVTSLRVAVAHALAHQARPRDHQIAQAVEMVRIFSREIKMLRPYATAWSAVSARRLEALEIAADAAAALVLGTAAVRDHLEATGDLNAGWVRTLTSFGSLFDDVGRRALVSEALPHVLAAGKPPDPMGSEIEGVVEAALSSPHQGIPARLAALSAVPTIPARSAADRRPAVDLVVGGWSSFGPWEAESTGDQWPLVSWDELAPAAGAHQADRVTAWVARVLERQGFADTSRDGVLTIIEQQHLPGRPALAALTGCQDNSETQTMVEAIVASALIHSGRASFCIDWTDVLVLRDSSGERIDVSVVAAQSLADPSGHFLRTWLTDRGISLDVPLGQEDPTLPHWFGAVSHVLGPWKGRRDMHLWSTGLVAVPIEPKVVRADKASDETESQRERLDVAHFGGLEALRARPGSFWIGEDEISGGDITPRLFIRNRVRIDLASGVTYNLRFTLESEYVDDAESVGMYLGHLLSIPIESQLTADVSGGPRNST